MTEFDHGWPEFWDLWATDRWEVATHDVLREVLSPGDIFLDVGAWIGPVSLWAWKLGAHIIAVEPDPVAFAELRFKLGGLERVELHEAALTLGEPATLAPNPKPEGAYGDSMSRLGKQGLSVKSMVLEEVLQGRVPKLMKMDVEGYEIELVPGIIDWFAAHEVAVHISCHGEVLDRKLFAGYREVRMPEHTWGDIVALP